MSQVGLGGGESISYRKTANEYHSLRPDLTLLALPLVVPPLLFLLLDERIGLVEELGSVQQIRATEGVRLLPVVLVVLVGTN